MSEEADRANRDPSSEGGVTALWHRLKEHRIAQWTVGYVAVAYGIQHAVTLTSEAFKWPDAVLRISMLLLILGVPIAMTLAWYHGERASRRVTGGELAIIAILLAIGAFLFYVFARPAEQTIAAAPAVEKSAAATSAPTGISIAVLPFLNLSGDPSQEYFSDGMTEEITSALAEIPKLPVVGRTSAFQFKGKNEDLSAIGQTLHAAYLLEGSVRKDGNEVRITAQLIKAATGDHVWTDSYDRELKGIFAVQEDVAKAIAAALRVPLGISQGESLVSNRDVDPDSYQNYLRAEALVTARYGNYSFAAPIALLEQVVARQPNYAPAWALLAQAYILTPGHALPSALSRESVEADFSKAETADRRAIALDPRNADAHDGLGQIQAFRGKLLDAEQSFKQALSLDPLNPDALHHYSLFLVQTGRVKQAVAMRKQLHALEPLIPTFNLDTAVILSIAGENTEALTIAQQSNAGGGIVESYVGAGRYQEAADELEKRAQNGVPGADDAARLVRTAPSQPSSQEKISYLGIYSFVFAYVGLPERALEYADWAEAVGIGFFAEYGMFWRSNGAESAVRKTAQFKTLVRELGLVDYWRAKGWPDLCHPTTGDDFACN